MGTIAIKLEFRRCLWKIGFLPGCVQGLPPLNPLPRPEICCGWYNVLLRWFEVFVAGLLHPSVCKAARRRASKSS